jgi:uncharacterized protein YjiS (DUF1127 family)
MMTTAIQTTGIAARRPASGATGLVTRIASVFGVWRERALSRAHLGTLDQRLLSDIGMSQADALREAGKPFWQA